MTPTHAVRSPLLIAPIALATLAVLAGGALAQPTQKVALMPVTGTNVHPGYLEAARDLMKDHLMGTGRFNVVMVAGEPGTMEMSSDVAVARGREVGAALAVVVHLTRLAGTGRLRLVAYDVGTGNFTHSDSIAIAGGPDDLDPALKRLAVGLATGKPASQTADIESVTQKQADPLLKESATKIFGLRLGALVAFNRPAGLDSAALPGIGVFWMYDARSFLGEVALDMNTADSGHGFAVSIGGYYPFSRSNLTPYLGTSAAYSFVDLGGAGASGIRITPAFGVLFGRLSTVQFRGEVGYFLNTFGERPDTTFTGEPAVPGAGTAKRFAHGPQFSVGLGF
jgi:hypothetical protein